MAVSPKIIRKKRPFNQFDNATVEELARIFHEQG